MSYRLGRFFGIDVRVHVTFFLLLAWVALGAQGSGVAALASVLFVLIVFSFVVLHEYGHALTARRFGIRTRSITLYPVGGVAMLERMPERPWQQIAVALAGPAVNFVLAGLAAVGLVAMGAPVPLPLLSRVDPTDGMEALLGALMTINLMLGGFNLLPALPMDGGRVLRAALALRMKGSELDATKIAARVARVVAVGMLFFAYGEQSITLAMIAAFVWIASSAEVRAAAFAQRGARAPFARGPRERSQDEDDEAPAARGAWAGWRRPSRDRDDPSASAREAAKRARVAGMLVEVVEGPNGPEVRVLRSR